MNKIERVDITNISIEDIVEPIEHSIHSVDILPPVKMVIYISQLKSIPQDLI